MSLQSTFCSSPWFHMRIAADGELGSCRWHPKTINTVDNIRNITPIDFFQKSMAPLRKNLLDGQAIHECNHCSHMEQHQKVSGRQRQLLKIGVSTDNFSKTLASSPWVAEFSKSQSDGIIELTPQDWQIELGNYCNSACVFCSPASSSKLATEFYKLKLIDALVPPSWCNDPKLVAKVIESITQCKNLKMLHFIGGEPLFIPAFKTILQAMVLANLHKSITISFTTNITIYEDDIVELLCNFDVVQIGMSIECFHPVNDYARWPSSIDQVTVCLNKWVSMAKLKNWIITIRPTPTVLTIHHLLSVYEFAWNNSLSLESANFLSWPLYMKPSVLPMSYRIRVIEKMKQWLVDHVVVTAQVAVNTRSSEFFKIQLFQELSSYIDYLETEPDESHLLPKLVDYLKLIESNRNNSILDYLPEYEELFRTAGY